MEADSGDERDKTESSDDELGDDEGCDLSGCSSDESEFAGCESASEHDHTVHDGSSSGDEQDALEQHHVGSDEESFASVAQLHRAGCCGA